MDQNRICTFVVVQNQYSTSICHRTTKQVHSKYQLPVQHCASCRLCLNNKDFQFSPYLVCSVLAIPSWYLFQKDLYVYLPYTLDQTDLHIYHRNLKKCAQSVVGIVLETNTIYFISWNALTSQMRKKTMNN